MVIVLVIVGVLGILGVAALVGIVAVLGKSASNRAGPPGVHSVETARDEMNKVLATAIPGASASHEQARASACKTGGGTGGVLKSTVHYDDPKHGGRDIVDVLAHRGWSNATKSTVPDSMSLHAFDGGASSADGNVTVTVTGYPSTSRSQAFIEIETAVTC